MTAVELQRTLALAKANRVYRARSELRREAAAGRVSLAGVLADERAGSATVRGVLEWFPRCGPSAASCVIAAAAERLGWILVPAAFEQKRVRDLTEHQVQALVDAAVSPRYLAGNSDVRSAVA